MAAVESKEIRLYKFLKLRHIIRSSKIVELTLMKSTIRRKNVLDMIPKSFKAYNLSISNSKKNILYYSRKQHQTLDIVYCWVFPVLIVGVFPCLWKPFAWKTLLGILAFGKTH